MAWEASSRRRALGCVFLTVAVLLLVGGETWFKGRLEGGLFVFYWLACFFFTGMAMVVAYLDMRALRRQTREAQRELVKETLKEIETDAREQARGNRRKG